LHKYGGLKVKKLKLVASGSRASETMTPGMYLVRCKQAEGKLRGRYNHVVLTFEVVEQAWNDGTDLKQWYNIKSGSKVSPHTKYARAWELAAEKEMQSGDDMDPAIFEGKVFEAYVGYRSDSHSTFDHSNTETKKDDRDFLRVHSLERLVHEEERAIGHMAPYGDTNIGVGGGGGRERSINTRTSS